ncbi:MAG: hypothetical protein KGL39_07530 [Patescibacteria group bacterium]|nr:hypothetical protein [Patescibacteria group bacterium]
MKKLLLGVLCAALFAVSALAQQSVQPYVVTGGGGSSPVSALPVGSASPGVPMPIAPATTSLVTGTASATGTGSTSLVAAVTGKALYLTSYSCTNSGVTASTVVFQDGSGGTTLWEISVPAATTVGIGTVLPMFHTTAGNALYFADGSSTTTMYCNAAGFSQ